MTQNIALQVSGKSKLAHPKVAQSFTSALLFRNRYQPLKDEDLTESVIGIECMSEGARLSLHSNENMPRHINTKVVSLVRILSIFLLFALMVGIQICFFWLMNLFCTLQR